MLQHFTCFNFASNKHVDVRRKACQEDGLLNCRITTSNDNKCFVAIKCTVTGGAVMDPTTVIFALTRYTELTVVTAGRNEHCPGLYLNIVNDNAFIRTFVVYC